MHRPVTFFHCDKNLCGNMLNQVHDIHKDIAALPPTHTNVKSEQLELAIPLKCM